jgi:ABC-type glycerol-3-phosphate transport system substrate-binding protein
MLRRRTAAWLLAAVLVIVPAGCGVGDEGGGGSLTEGDSKEFTYWSMWESDEPQAEVLKDAIASFEQQSGITVNVEWQGRNVLQKLTPTLRTGNVPDLVDQDGNLVRASLVKPGAHLDLSGLYDLEVPGEGKTVADVIPDKYVDLVRDDQGRPYMVPYEVIAYALWYDANSLPAVEKDPPATWEDFLALLQERKQAGQAPLAQDGDIGFYNSLWTGHALVRALGAGGLNETVADESGEAWKDPRILEALKAVEGLVRSDQFIEGYDGSKWPAVQERWAKGDAAFLLMGSWAPSETQPSAPKDFEYASFEFPRLVGSDESVQAGVIGFAIPERAEHADAAAKFVAHLLNKDRLSGIAENALNLTPRSDVPVPDELTDLKTIIEERPVALPYDGADADFPNYAVEVFDPLSTDLLTGKLTAEQFVERIAAKQAEYWKKNA